MLSWPDHASWKADNQWRPLTTVPLHEPVDVFAHRWDEALACAAGGRVHGCVWDGQAWRGLPPGQVPKFWAAPMSSKRIRQRTLP